MAQAYLELHQETGDIPSDLNRGVTNTPLLKSREERVCKAVHLWLLVLSAFKKCSPTLQLRRQESIQLQHYEL